MARLTKRACAPVGPVPFPKPPTPIGWAGLFGKVGLPETPVSGRNGTKRERHRRCLLTSSSDKG